MSSAAEYKLKKGVWTADDFDQMGWHDCRLHGFALDGENHRLLFDIDYIFSWVNPAAGETHYSFWVSPSTLVFENVYDIKMNLEGTSVDILAITRENPCRPRNADFIGLDKEWTWVLECVSADVEFRSVGYRQYVRALPKHINGQHFSLAERGGVDFSEAAYTFP